MSETPIGFWSSMREALCSDLPFILDSAWRRREFETNRLFDYTVKYDDSGADVERVADHRLPVFWMFIATLAFFAYGPTFDALCSIFTARFMPAFRVSVALLVAIAALRLFVQAYKGGMQRAAKRIRKQSIGDKTWRARMVRTGVRLGSLVIVAPLGFFAWYHVNHAGDTGCIAAPMGPARWQLLIFIAAVVAVVVRSTVARGTWRRTLEQTAVLLVAAGTLLWAAAPNASEALQGPYPHVYAVVAIGLALIACVAPAIAQWQFGSLDPGELKPARDALQTVELFPAPRANTVEITWRRAGSALLVGSLSNPLHLLLMPALVTLMVPAQGMWWWFGGALFGSALLLMVGNLSSRWQQMILHIRRWFLIGTPLGVSVLAIVMAVLRLAQFQYVSTILDAAPFGIVFSWVMMAYALFWWFESQVNSVIGRTLLSELDAQASDEAKCANYPIKREYAGTVNAIGRYIAPHAPGRFAIMGWFRHHESNEVIKAFHSFDLLALFRSLLPTGNDDLIHDLNRRMQLYFLSINALVLGLAIALFTYYGHGDKTNSVAPVVTARMPPRDTKYSNLAALLAEQAKQGRPAILVAASGGGTRAALFTASALEGLAKLGHAQDIVLLSGVSGGGVASAYFAGHRAELIGGSPSAWTDFKNRVTEPFIRDVLDGAGEWRVISEQPLGNLLAESFERRLFPEDQRIGQFTDPALILNTTVTGHPQEQSAILRGMFARVHSQDCNRLHRPYSFLSGERLIFTNLQADHAFPGDASILPDVRFPYIVVRDPKIPLARAAALNANFPPVFPNARVDVTVDDPQCPTRAYYVTDGGATENLGLVSALYALRAALHELAPESRPVIHIVAVEASATGYDYSQDRGIGAATGGAKERLVGGLTEDLLEEICGQVDEPGCRGKALQLHYLSMPLVFRSRGGFGTHWMFPDSITVENPRPAVQPSLLGTIRDSFTHRVRTSVTIDRDELMQLWSALHDPDTAFCTRRFEREEERDIAKWICGAGRAAFPPDLHVTEWQRLVESLKPLKL